MYLYVVDIHIHNMCLSLCLPASFFLCLHLSIYLFFALHTCLPVCLSIYSPVFRRPVRKQFGLTRSQTPRTFTKPRSPRGAQKHWGPMAYPPRLQPAFVVWYIFMYIYIYIHTYPHCCVRVCTYVCMYVCIHICIYA